MQFNFLSIGAIALLVSSVAAEGIHLGGKRAPLPENCKRAVSALPNVNVQTTAVNPQPTTPGTGSGGIGNRNGTTPSIVARPSASATSKPASSNKNDAGLVRMEWTMGALAVAAGVVVIAL